MKDIPNVGLGFWQIKKEDVDHVLKDGLEAGYIHIDTAVAYDNEAEIGEALKKYNVKRENIWITSKVPAEIKDYEGAKKVIRESLARLDCGYLDLMLIHAPKPWALMWIKGGPRFEKGNREVWKALEEAKEEGLIKNIGVSNFNVRDIENITAVSKTPIFLNQIELHVGKVDEEVVEYCKAHDILVEAYSPNAVGKLINNKDIKSIADKYGVSNAQLCIKFCLQLGTIPLPRSKSKDHINENLKLDFEISSEDMKYLLSL